MTSFSQAVRALGLEGGTGNQPVNPQVAQDRLQPNKKKVPRRGSTPGTTFDAVNTMTGAVGRLF
jgi:hypothetical protein